MEESATSTVDTVLADGTNFFEWVVDSAITLIDKLMSNPLTSIFLIAGLIGFIFVTFKMIVRR